MYSAVALALPVVAMDSASCIQTTHGCIALNPDVTDDTVGRTICKKGYTKSVRPLPSYTNGVKRRLMNQQGIAPDRAAEYELDHIVPLAIGGHPHHPSNLVLQPWEGPLGAKAKDKLESRLQSLICTQRLELRDAQLCIAEDWVACEARTRRHLRKPRGQREGE